MKIYFFLLFFCVLGFTAQAQKDCPRGIEYGPGCNVVNNITKFDECQNGYKFFRLSKTTGVCKCIAELQRQEAEADKKARAIRAEVERRLKAEKAKAPYSPPPAPKDSDLTAPEKVTKKSGAKIDTFIPADPYNGVDLRKKDPPKKPEPTVSAGEDEAPPPAKKDSISSDTIPKYYKIGLGPFVGIVGQSNKSPNFNSKFLWGTVVGLTLRSQFIDGPAKGLGFHFSPSYYLGMKKENTLDDSYSAWAKKESSNLKGLLLKAGVEYRFLHVAKVSLDYGWSPNKELPNQGISGGLGLFFEPTPNIELEIGGGAIYHHCVEYFGGLKVSYNFWFKPKP